MATSPVNIDRACARWAKIADRIVRGASPAETPVEMPTLYRFAIDPEAARAISLMLQPDLLLRWTGVIEGDGRANR